MARRKGKSRSRIKGWQGRLLADGDAEAGAARRQRHNPPAVKLPPRELSAGQENLDDLPRAEGVVMGLFPGGVMVRVGGRELQCGIAKTFRAPEGASALVVGDNVTVALANPQHLSDRSDADKVRSDGVILAREARRTVLSRPQPRYGRRRDEYAGETFEKVFVANMDVLLIVAATRQPPLRRGLIDRYLIIAERGDLRSVLVINKIDLGPPDPEVLADLTSLGIGILPCSALTGEGLEPLRAALVGKRSVLAGASGVGKSALINALIPGARAVIGSIRPSNERGRHTTSSVTIYELGEGGIIVDTPGVRQLGLRMDVSLLPWYFPEFEQRAGQCRFNDCMHTREPGCAIRAAIERGEIPARRYDGYLRLLETLEDK